MAQQGQPHIHFPNLQGQQAGGVGTPPAPGSGTQSPQPRAGMVTPMGFGPQNLVQNGGRTVRQEGVGPNGERWTVTYNEVNMAGRPQQPVQQQLFPQPPGFGLPARPTASPAPADVIDRLMPRIRAILQGARQEMENVRALFQTPGPQQQSTTGQLPSSVPPNWRVPRIREQLQVMSRNLDMVERGLAAIHGDASLAQNTDVAALRQSANELRAYADEMNRMLVTLQGNSSEVPASSAATEQSSSTTSADSTHTPSESVSTQSQAQPAPATMPAGTPTELFLLSSPQGPVGVVFDQRGTFTTAPIVPTLPFQTFTNQFAQNRQLIAGLGQQLGQGPTQLHSLANIQPTPTQPPTAGNQAPNQPQQQPQNQAQLQQQGQNAPPAAAHGNANPNAPPEDRMANIAGHLWLILKLACFVYFFAGGGNYYRPLILGLIAALVYLAQIGLFEDQFALVRRHFEALLPVGALADRVAQQPTRNTAANPRNLTPEQAAQRLLLQQRENRFGWVRDGMRSVERAFALFVASLWPGIGERMVHVQEERVRLERVAEEEERVRREEAQRAEAERQQQQESGEKKDEPEVGAVVAGEGEANGPSEKGKQRAEEAITGEASSS